MPGSLLRLRSRLMTPSRRQTSMAYRGFRPRDDAARVSLELPGNAFLDGFAIGAGAATAGDAAGGLDRLPLPLRGFGYEGAAMALAMLEAVRPWRAELPGYLNGPADPHVYMAHVGVGWALARLPRWLRARPAAAVHDPVLGWLVLDGYGFHQAYFLTGRYVREQRREHGLSWFGHADDEPVRAVFDQGIGRALWFVCGADPSQLASTLASFPADRQADLFSGLGLAIGYAGGGNSEVWAAVCRLAGRHLPQLGQGAVFAAETRARAGNVVPNTEAATAALAGLSVAEAAELAAATKPSGNTADGMVSYQAWRMRIAEQLPARTAGTPS